MKTKNLVLIALFTSLTAVGAFIAIPVPVCPFTLQLLFTTLAGILLGAKKGALSVLCYLVIGLIGLPVFTQGGGIGYIFQPTFGYLIGFAVGAFVTGYIANRKDKPTFLRLLIAGFAGLIIVYAFGMTYLWAIKTFYIGSGIGFKVLIINCFVFAVPGDILLCILAAVVGKRLIPVVKRMGVLK